MNYSVLQHQIFWELQEVDKRKYSHLGSMQVTEDSKWTLSLSIQSCHLSWFLTVCPSTDPWSPHNNFYPGLSRVEFIGSIRMKMVHSSPKLLNNSLLSAFFFFPPSLSASSYFLSGLSAYCLNSSFTSFPSSLENSVSCSVSSSLVRKNPVWGWHLA